jgi:hypothetical protein
VFVHVSLHEIALRAARDRIRDQVSDSVVLPVDAHDFVLATVVARLFDQLREFVQREPESKVTLFRFVLILPEDRFDRTYAARGFDAIMGALSHTAPVC